MELFEFRDEIVYDGVCVARMRLSLPVLEGGGGLFYRRLSKMAGGWFRERFSEIAISDYQLCPDPRKRWRYSPALFIVKSELRESKGKYYCLLEIVCARQGRAPVRRLRLHSWCKRGGRMMPCLFRKTKK